MSTPTPTRPASRRRTALTRPLLALLVLAAACTTGGGTTPYPDGALTQGSTLHSVTVGDSLREYRVYLPRRLASPAPLVMVFHGYTGNAARTEQEFGWNELADSEGFVVAYPEGLNEGFNAGGCCGASSETGVDDVGATLAILDDLGAAVPLDPRRLYVTGFSNGGAMAYRLACETDRFAAFGPVAGGLVVDCDDARPTSILHIHGLADSIVPFAGDAGVWRLPIADAVAGWRARDDCARASVTTNGPTRLEASACASGREVSLLTVGGLGHAWPTRADGLDATATLWAFFSRHDRG